MNPVRDLYVERDSWLHRLDPRVKVIAVALAIVAILLFRHVLVILLALALAHALIASARVPVHRVTWVWKRMLYLNLLIPALFVVFYPEGTGLFAIGRWAFTPLALLRGAALVLRLDAIAFTVFAWLFTTDQTRIVRAFVRLGMPFEAALVLAIALRYIPTFYGLWGSISDAQQARALDLSHGGLLQRLRRHIPILVAMMISALRTADRLGKALEARGLGAPGQRRTCLREIAFRPADYLALALVLASFAGALTARFVWGFGAELLTLLP